VNRPSTIDQAALLSESRRARPDRPQITLTVFPGASADQLAPAAARSVLRCDANSSLTVARSIAHNSQLVPWEHHLTNLLELSWSLVR
jgi:hypothetical protein